MANSNISIKAARIDNGYTQEELAVKLGVSKRTIVGWENGTAELKPYVLYSLAYIFEMSADNLRIPAKNQFD